MKLPMSTGSVLPTSLPSLPLSETSADDVDLVLGATLGEGGMGIVCLARQVSLDREVVVKRVRPGAPLRAGEALVREARVAGGLEHPNIVPIHALGLDAEGVPALVMKRIEGLAWSALIREKPDDLERHLAILGAVCLAVHYAHSRGILHRDLKPDNVMIGRFGEVYVVDWGIAARLEPGAHTEAIAGTPVYMAPEMITVGAAISPRTDVYLLGACLHEVLTGSAPHRGDRLADVFASVEDSTPRDYPRVPDALAEIARRALARDPADRYPSAEALNGAIAWYIRHRSSLALADAARGRLAELRAQLASGSASSVRMEELFTEARFGFRQAAEASGDENLARTDLTALIREMVRWKLTHGDLGGAEGLLSQVEDPALRAELAARRAEQDAASNLVKDLDPRRNAAGRMVAIVSMLGYFALVTLVILGAIASDVTEYDHPTAFFVAATTTTIMCAGILGMRRWLLATSFNRVITGAAALSAFAVLANRGLAWGFGTPLPAVMATDLLFVSTAILGTLGWIAPILRLTALPYAIGAIAIALFPAHTMGIFSVSALVGISLLLLLSWWTWGRER